MSVEGIISVGAMLLVAIGGAIIKLALDVNTLKADVKYIKKGIGEVKHVISIAPKNKKHDDDEGDDE